MITPANSATYSYENPQDQFPFESKPVFVPLRPMIGDFPVITENQSISNLGEEAFVRNGLSAIIEAVKKYAVEFFSKIGPFVYLVVGFLAAGSYKLFGSLIKVQIDQMNIAAQQQIQQPPVQQLQEGVQTVHHHHHHEHHVYHHYPQERRRSFSIPACDRMAFERLNTAHLIGIVN